LALKSDLNRVYWPTRREFAAIIPSLAAAGVQAPTASRFVKGICAGIFPRSMPYADRCRQAKKAGFDAIELPLSGELSLSSPPDQLKRLGEAADRSGVVIASLWVSPLSDAPLNSPDPQVRERGIEAIKKSVEFATWLNCGALLLVPGRVGSGARFNIGYETTWQRISVELPKAITFAEKAKVLLTLENVSNRFLVSPLEMRAFVDQFKSPWLQVHFDIGNVMYFGYPQDWILTLGPRIKRVHLKDRKAAPQAEAARTSGLLEGDVDWPAVMAALVKVDYRGYLCPEIGHDASNPSQLADVSKAVDKILAMA
jgi:hexulose-6-phosphate isomerase